MARDKINDLFDAKGEGSLVNSNFMKALEDIDYDIVQLDLDSATSDELESERFKDLEQDVDPGRLVCVLDEEVDGTGEEEREQTSKR